MKLFLGIKYFEDNRNIDLIEDISNLLASEGIEVINVIRDIEKYGQHNLSARELMNKTFEAIDQCDIVLIELSFKGVGLGIEAGYAAAKKIPIVSITNTEGSISKSLEGISIATFSYGDLAKLRDFLNELEGILDT